MGDGEALTVERIREDLEPSAVGSLSESDLREAAMMMEIGQYPTLYEEVQEGEDSPYMRVNSAKGYSHTDDVSALLEDVSHAYLLDAEEGYSEELEDPEEFYEDFIEEVREIQDVSARDTAEEIVNLYGEQVLEYFHSDVTSEQLFDEIQESQPVNVLKSRRTSKSSDGHNPVLGDYVGRLEVYMGGELLTAVDFTMDDDTMMEHLVEEPRKEGATFQETYIGQKRALNGNHISDNPEKIREDIGWEKPSRSIRDFFSWG